MMREGFRDTAPKRGDREPVPVDVCGPCPLVGGTGALICSLHPIPSPVSPTPHWHLTGAASCRKSHNSVEGGGSLETHGLHTHRHLHIAQLPACLLDRGEPPPPQPAIPSPIPESGPWATQGNTCTSNGGNGNVPIHFATLM